ncbi:hypothetical protein GMORB2_1541 [Geosmithia morbida]|uniref:Uncharacterized protein n=1 Tax=Geosmithia morbida TaxID=1094350 RepID=A0A9P4YTU8_9HYPO|nr:uncharacterized protein GMORB2_1541 [Geosmithia morbida]KAF4121702.1 hypothetical protein GMORB2_1541 [Geosmithia morbida]
MSAPPGTQVPIDPALLREQHLHGWQSASSSAPPPTKRCRRRRPPRRPARNSLYDLMHEHAGTSLFVRPLFWTDVHSRLLDVRFRELEPCDTPTPHHDSSTDTAPSKNHMRPSPSVVTLSDALTELLLPSSPHHGPTTNAVKKVLETLWPNAFRTPRHLPTFHLHFGDHVYYEAVRAQVMWEYAPVAATGPGPTPSESLDSSDRADSCTPSSTPVPGPESISVPQRRIPMMCYLGKSQLASMRRNIFRISPGPYSSGNEPVLRLQKLRSKMLVPADDDQDPHMIGIFLAMAQKYFYDTPSLPSHPYRLRQARPTSQQRRLSPRPEFHDIKLRVLTQDSETCEFIVYTAIVTAAFLQRFHDPFSHPADGGSSAGMDIQYTRVPAWPIVGLRERMGRALGEEVVGPFDPNDMEMWGDETEMETETDAETVESSSRIVTSTKRKREALSEVVHNGTFDGDSSDDSDGGDGADEPTFSSKKRCLSEGSIVGVVI